MGGLTMALDTYQVMFPAKVRFGVGSLDTLADEVDNLGAERVLIVSDPGVCEAGLVDKVKEQLPNPRLSVDVFSRVEPDPTFLILDNAYQELHSNRYDLLIAVGGGSSIDTAKGLSMLLAHGGRGEDYVGTDKVPGPGIPLFALPTTAGTGSEVTNVCIFSDPEKKVKVAIFSPFLLARLALVDPRLTYGCPPQITAATGMDALVHAIESYTGKKANSFCNALALKAISLIAANLRASVRNGSHQEARNRMAEGALLAGIAFGNSGVAAVHALAYILGSRFHVPHGLANSILLSHVMQVNLPADLPKHADVARMLGVKTQGLSHKEAAEQGVAAVKTLIADIGIPAHLRDLGIPRNALEEMSLASMGITRLLAVNSKQLTLDDVRQIWANAW
jgi:alcohol dehydrogenase class IV